MQQQKKKKKNIFFKIIGASGMLSIAFFLIILICFLMLLDFFGTTLTKEKIQANASYADAYITAVNSYLMNGYVPLQRLLYFHLEDTSLSLEALYAMNQDKDTKKAKEIKKVCKDQRVKNMVACTEGNIKENEEYLVVSTGHFNFPLANAFRVTSFFGQEREIFGAKDTHSGWDLAAPEKTPVYSVCSGTVIKVNYTQEENITYDQSKNEIGNTITIKCDEDYDDTFYVVYAHLYPKSAKVKKGDKVRHWTEIASVGTTGQSTGNHLHYQVEDENRTLIDGMNLIDFTLSKDSDFGFQNPTFKR